MLSYLLRKLLLGVPVLFGVTIIVFAIAHAMPGDAVLAMITAEAPSSEELIAMRRGELGLDQPLYIQYLNWIGQILHGNLGRSFVNGRSVAAIIGERLPMTLELMGVALLAAFVIGTTLGVISALRQYRLTDYSLTLGGFVGVSIPDFFMGLLLVYVFALELRWLPSSGISTAGESFSLADNLRHLVLPAAALALFRAAIFMRYARAGMLEVLNQSYMRTARAKGLKPSTIVLRHGLRNALIPLVTVFGLALPTLFGGSVVIETIFQWPGIGLMFIDAVVNRDSPVIMGYVLITAIIVMLANLATDLAYSVLDPRVSYD
ncbi:ABC transporter permease [Mesorhizobium amorphae]|uniref:Oligopeptide ABC transporter permease n=1 Tax=Mesorhizobium amorphae CCNWGS0123 TaxID=1082933 RepID=G6Y7T9_9HYPH|nr:ABC transporter permease [Mesorhizobium amorphae]ANT50949.1 peptide permease [Mesorhizobium amorphae CCNWGS0123]EHH12173.1 oligopeptide ABC transporter permease [Mesorhizobium amorphae CCNWGS0123]GLR42888.1 oligopeptide transport system permease protein AppB [Mesorhizobium amorphae]